MKRLIDTLYIVKKQICVRKDFLEAFKWYKSRRLNCGVNSGAAAHFENIADKFRLQKRLTAAYRYTSARFLIEIAVRQDFCEKLIQVDVIAAPFPRVVKADIRTSAAANTARGERFPAEAAAFPAANAFIGIKH